MFSKNQSEQDSLPKPPFNNDERVELESGETEYLCKSQLIAEIKFIQESLQLLISKRQTAFLIYQQVREEAEVLAQVAATICAERKIVFKEE